MSKHSLPVVEDAPLRPRKTGASLNVIEALPRDQERVSVWPEFRVLACGPLRTLVSSLKEGESPRHRAVWWFGDKGI